MMMMPRNNHTEDNVMDTIQQAITLNNVGVTALVECNDKFAIQSLTDSMKLLKQVISKRHPLESHEPSPLLLHKATDPSTDSYTTMSYDVSKESEVSTCVELSPIPREHQLLMFNRALTLSTTTPKERDNKDNKSGSKHDIIVYIATVIFNLALAHHRNGICHGRAASSVKASQLYGSVLRLLVDYDNDTHTESNTLFLPMVVIIKLASINNLVQLSFCSGNLKLAHDGFSHLSNTFLTKSIQFLHYKSNIYDLYLKILVLIPPRVAPAA